jgi:hypothetical protein
MRYTSIIHAHTVKKEREREEEICTVGRLLRKPRSKVESASDRQLEGVPLGASFFFVFFE